MGGNGSNSNSSALALTGSDITRSLCFESYSLNAEGCVRRTRVSGGRGGTLCGRRVRASHTRFSSDIGDRKKIRSFSVLFVSIPRP